MDVLEQTKVFSTYRDLKPASSLFSVPTSPAAAAVATVVKLAADSMRATVACHIFLRSSFLAVLELGRSRTPFLRIRTVALQDGHPRGISQTNWIILITLKMAAIAAETSL
jgi:hypothetical protein